MNETANYKKYVVRQMGLKEAQFAPFPKTDPLSEPPMSPTARPPTILAVGIRGSSSGGLPSGADQLGKDISPTKIGGYDRVEPQNLNSKMVNKTPNNPEIQQNVVPINNNPSTGNGVTHPHQIQVTAQEEPQAVTGASTDTDPTLTLKSAAPKAIEVDVAQENADSEEEERNNNNNTAMIPSTSLSETFARHRKLMLEKLGLCSCGHKPSECDCKPDCKCNCNKKVEECATCGCGDPTDMHDHDKDPAAGMPQDNVGHGSLPEEQQRLDESYAAPFQRMRSLAGVGNMILTSNGIFENKNDPGASKPFNTHWKMDKEKAGYVKIDENKLKKVHATLERKSKRGSLSDKEMELVKRLNAVLSKRGRSSH